MIKLWNLAALPAVLAALAGAAHACDTCKSGLKPGTYTGEARVVGNGVVYSWVTLNEKGKPAAMGVNITETALTGLPETPPAGMMWAEYVLALPKEAAKTGFDHVMVNWNPKGHIPKGIYDTPHFDIHFYTMSSEERMKITAKGDDLAKCQRKPAAEFIPEGYIYAPGGEEPEMGSHWVHPASPELNGQPFTKTFLYGSYDGRLIFFEPMLTKAYLETRPEHSEPIKLPAFYEKSGFYPTRYSVRYDAGRKEYVISLDGLTWREGRKPEAAKPGKVATR